MVSFTINHEVMRGVEAQHIETLKRVTYNAKKGYNLSEN